MQKKCSGFDSISSIGSLSVCGKFAASVFPTVVKYILKLFAMSVLSVQGSPLDVIKTKQARARQIILSGILPVFGNRVQGYRNSKRMAVNGMVERFCKEEDVGYVDIWDSFVGKEV